MTSRDLQRALSTPARNSIRALFGTTDLPVTASPQPTRAAPIATPTSPRHRRHARNPHYASLPPPIRTTFSTPTPTRSSVDSAPRSPTGHATIRPPTSARQSRRSQRRTNRRARPSPRDRRRRPRAPRSPTAPLDMLGTISDGASLSDSEGWQIVALAAAAALTYRVTTPVVPHVIPVHRVTPGHPPAVAHHTGKKDDRNPTHRTSAKKRPSSPPQTLRRRDRRPRLSLQELWAAAAPRNHRSAPTRGSLPSEVGPFSSPTRYRFDPARSTPRHPRLESRRAPPRTNSTKRTQRPVPLSEAMYRQHTPARLTTAHNEFQISADRRGTCPFCGKSLVDVKKHISKAHHCPNTQLADAIGYPVCICGQAVQSLNRHWGKKACAFWELRQVLPIIGTSRRTPLPLNVSVATMDTIPASQQHLLPATTVPPEYTGLDAPYVSTTVPHPPQQPPPRTEEPLPVLSCHYHYPQRNSISRRLCYRRYAVHQTYVLGHHNLLHRHYPHHRWMTCWTASIPKYRTSLPPHHRGFHSSYQPRPRSIPTDRTSTSRHLIQL